MFPVRYECGHGVDRERTEVRQRIECQYPDCGQTKHGNRHEGFKADHDFIAPARKGFGQQRKPIAARSARPNRVERRQEVAQARSERREAVSYCEAKSHGVASPCGVGPDAILEASHVYGLGMGGGKEHGEVRMLCRLHHRMLDEDRATFREAGLSKRAPRSEKTAPRWYELQQKAPDTE